MNFRKSRNLMWIGFAAGLLIMGAGIGTENEKATGVFVVVGMIIFIAALLQAFVFYT